MPTEIFARADAIIPRAIVTIFVAPAEDNRSPLDRQSAQLNLVHVDPRSRENSARARSVRTTSQDTNKSHDARGPWPASRPLAASSVRARFAGSAKYSKRRVGRRAQTAQGQTWTDGCRPSSNIDGIHIRAFPALWFAACPVGHPRTPTKSAGSLAFAPG